MSVSGCTTLVGYLQYTDIEETFVLGTLITTNANFTISPAPVNPTPEPSSGVEVGLGLVGLAGRALTHRSSIRALPSTSIGEEDPASQPETANPQGR